LVISTEIPTTPEITTANQYEPGIAADLQNVIIMQNNEDWRYGLTDLNIFISTPNVHVYLLYLTEPSRTCIGSIIVSNFNEKHLMIGGFIISKHCRGNGYGSQVMTQALEQHPYQQAHLLCFKERVPFYRRCNFQEVGDMKNYFIPLNFNCQFVENFEPLTDKDKDLILEYDKALFDMSRADLIKRMLYDPAIDSCLNYQFNNGKQTVEGWGLARKLRGNSIRLSICAASNKAFFSILEKLFHLILASSNYNNSNKIIIDCADFNKQELFLKIGFKISNVSYPIMRAKGDKPLPSYSAKEVYAILSEEVG